MSDLNMVSNEIEDRSKRLQEELQKQVSYLNDISSDIKKLTNDSVVTQSNIDKISGALQAYAETTKLVKGDSPNLQKSE